MVGQRDVIVKKSFRLAIHECLPGAEAELYADWEAEEPSHQRESETRERKTASGRL